MRYYILFVLLITFLFLHWYEVYHTVQYLRRGWKITVMFLAPGLHTNFISPPSIKLSSAPPRTQETGRRSIKHVKTDIYFSVVALFGGYFNCTVWKLICVDHVTWRRFYSLSGSAFNWPTQTENFNNHHCVVSINQSQGCCSVGDPELWSP